MVRRSSIKRLPANVRRHIDKWLANGQATLDDITAYLNEQGHEVSRSSVGRYAKNFEKVAAHLRESREMAEALVQEIGPAATEGKVGRMLVEVLQKLVFDILLRKAQAADDPLKEDDQATPKELHLLARTLKDMASAQKIEVERELKIRTETATLAAEAAVSIATDAGMSVERIEEFRKSILGLTQ